MARWEKYIPLKADEAGDLGRLSYSVQKILRQIGSDMAVLEDTHPVYWFNKAHIPWLEAAAMTHHDSEPFLRLIAVVLRFERGVLLQWNSWEGEE